MRRVTLLRGLAVSGLVLIFTASVLYAAGSIMRDLFLYLLVAGTVLWFGGILIARRTGGRHATEIPNEHKN
ncbi:MAG TPA: hypothetical protein ENO20_11850 [Bacteroides sp.]|nr:hypothetical protein [Bacteroides sp.]